MVSPIAPDHELHRRRFGRNVGVALCLVGFAAVMFGLSVVKLLEAGPVEGYDHAPRASVTTFEGAAEAGR